MRTTSYQRTRHACWKTALWQLVVVVATGLVIGSQREKCWHDAAPAPRSAAMHVVRALAESGHA